MHRTYLGWLGLFLLSQVHAGEQSPVGLWKTVDDETHQVRAYVRIVDDAGVFSATVTKVFPGPGEPAEPRCKQCSGARHDQPIVGMNIVWGMRQNDQAEWTGGEILDPESGKTYRCSFELIDAGTRLKVRGYIGFALLGRTQIWQRAEQ